MPDAGLISLALVLKTVGLPFEILPLLLTVDWLLSRCRAMTNVTSDILVAVLIDRFTPEEPDDDLPTWRLLTPDGLALRFRPRGHWDLVLASDPV